MRANIKSISHRCYLFEVAFVCELTKETIHLPLGCLQGGTGKFDGYCAGTATNNRGRNAPNWSSAYPQVPTTEACSPLAHSPRRILAAQASPERYSSADRFASRGEKEQVLRQREKEGARWCWIRCRRWSSAPLRGPRCCESPAPPGAQGAWGSLANTHHHPRTLNPMDPALRACVDTPPPAPRDHRPKRSVQAL